MSMNLRLGGFPLRQTPTAVSYEAVAPGADPKAVYFAWLDRLVEQGKPRIHPRATNAQRKAIQSTPAWREHERYRDEIDKHKRAVETFLAAHPQVRWEVD